MSDTKREKVEQTLSRLLVFLDDFLPLANTHVADFLIDDCWSRLVPDKVQSQLLALNEAELAKLPSGEIYKLSSLEGNHESGDTHGNSGSDDNHHGDTPHGNSVHSDVVCKVDKELSSTTRTTWDRTRLPEWRNRDLESFIVEAQGLTLPYLGVLTDLSNLVQTWRRTRTEKVFVGEFMSEKKKHEVDVMADVCSVIASHCQTDTVIDIGSGRGYLSSHLCLMHGLSVLAVDSSTVNTHSAQTRNLRLEKHWSGLVRNANNKHTNADKGANKDTNNKSKPGNKGTDKKNSEDSKPTNTNLSQKEDMREPDTNKEMSAKRTGQRAETRTCPTVGETSGVVPLVDKPPKGGASEERTISGASADAHSAVTAASKSKCVQITQFITPETDLRHLVRVHLPDREVVSSRDAGASASDKVTSREPETSGDRRESEKSVLLTGLHTCGNLASSMLEILCGSGAAGAVGAVGAAGMCNVGCCYHHLDEAYLQGPFEAGGRPSHFGFPMSRLLTSGGVQLGRNARMLASQTPARMANTGLVSHKSLFYRALLQVMLHDLKGEVSDDWHVGKIYAKSHDFTDYAQRALKKLHIDDGGKWTRDLVQQYEARFAVDQSRLTAFVQLRAALAPVVETFILLDRLLYLLEQKVVSEAYLVQMFDPVTSPRCYGLIATRR